MSEKARQIRSKIVGLLMRSARENAGKSQKDMAKALGVTARRISQYELGEKDISLPELEVVATLCNVPVMYFFDETVMVTPPKVPSGRALELRRKIIGALLKQARTEANISQKECAVATGISTRRLSQYEYGEKDIPLSELETLARHLNVSMDYFVVPQSEEQKLTSREVFPSSSG